MGIALERQENQRVFVLIVADTVHGLSVQSTRWHDSTYQIDRDAAVLYQARQFDVSSITRKMSGQSLAIECRAA
jgi:hypothetical protein